MASQLQHPSRFSALVAEVRFHLRQGHWRTWQWLADRLLDSKFDREFGIQSAKRRGTVELGFDSPDLFHYQAVSYRDLREVVRALTISLHWPELCEWLGKDPDQTGLELFAKLKSKYPDCYTAGQLRTLQRRLKCWRHEAVKRLICEMQDFTQDVGSGTG